MTNFYLYVFLIIIFLNCVETKKRKIEIDSKENEDKKENFKEKEDKKEVTEEKGIKKEVSKDTVKSKQNLMQDEEFLYWFH